MTRQTKTAEEIQALVQAEVDKIQEIVEDGEHVDIPLPYQHEPDESGANWNISIIRNGNGYIHSIALIVEGARQKYELK